MKPVKHTCMYNCLCVYIHDQGNRNQGAKGAQAPLHFCRGGLASAEIVRFNYVLFMMSMCQSYTLAVTGI